jgi:membrane fusion protein (multidrug efflux system)
MKNLKILFSFYLIFLIVASCGKKNVVENTAAVDDAAIYRVKTMILEKQEVSQNIEYTANLLPFEEINYAPASPGRIEEILVEVGSHVSKGDVIARMERTQLQQASEQYQSARSNFQRMDTLFKLNSISEQAYEAAKTQYEMSKSGYEFLTKNTTLVSPINAIVTGKYFESGELYSGVPNTAAGKAAIVTLMQINPLKIIVNVSERYFPLTKKGMKAAIHVDIFPNLNFTGEVSSIYPTISSDTRTFPIEIVVPNSDEVLRPGMFARVALNLGETNTLLLPAIAVVRQEGTNDRYVYLAESDSTARKVLVNLGARYDDRLEIISGEVKEGARIIISGQEKLLENSKITIVE